MTIAYKSKLTGVNVPSITEVRQSISISHRGGSRDETYSATARRSSLWVLTARTTAIAAAFAAYVPLAATGAEPSPVGKAGTSVDTPIQFDIPAQDLSRALSAFTAQSRVQVLYEGDVAKGLRSAPLKGAYTPEQALKTLLTGAPVQARFTGKRTVTLERRATPVPSVSNGGDPVALGKVTVSAAAEYDANDPYSKSYVAPRTSIATKTDTPVMETPLSVQTVTRPVMDDQQVITVEDAVKNVSGVQRDWGYGTLYDSFIIRGFPTLQSSVYRNGFRLTGYAAETANVQSIDVLKGPVAMLYGRVDPGGLVNLDIKKPLSQPFYSLQQQFGSYDFYRTTADATGPVPGNEALQYRFNLAYTGANSFRDFVFTDRVFVTPSLTWRISDDTEVNLNFEYKNTDFNIDHGIPAVGKRPAPVPISRNLGEPGTDTHTDDYLVDLNWSHRFNQDWEIRNGFVAHLQDYFLQTIVSPFLEDDGHTVGRFANFTDYDRHQYGSYIDLTGHFETFGAKHAVLLGTDWYQAAQDSVGSFRETTTIDLYNPVYGTVDLAQQRFLRDHAPNSFFTETNQWFGLYFQDQITLWDKFHILGGGRQDWTSAESGFSETSFASIEQAKVNTDRFQPRVGLLYEPWQWLSVYGNYVESLGAANGRSSTGGPLKPEVADQFEGGLKTEFFDGRFIGTLAYFQIDKRNMLTADISTPDLFDQTTIGRARSRGIEVDLKGQLTDDLSLIATYAFIDARITKNFDGTQGNQLPNVPENSGSLWTKYDFHGTALDGFSLGTGVYLASQRQGDNENTFQLPGYVRWDAMAAYRFKVGPTRLTTQINVNNILDKHYYKSTDVIDGNPKGRISPAEPLTVIGSIRLEY